MPKAWAHAFMGGPRFSARRAKVTPFGQFLVGMWRGTVSVLGESESESDFATRENGRPDAATSDRPIVTRQMSPGDYGSAIA